MILGLLMAVESWGVSPQQALDSFLRECGVNRDAVAVCVTSLRDSETIASHNGSRPLIPASILKSVTIAALLQKGGIDFRFFTPVYIDGPIDLGVMRGNLVIEGSGDPSLHSVENPGSSDFIDEIVKALRIQGITKIEGDIIIDESGFSGEGRPDSWMSADFPHSYGTAFHGFNFEDNANGSKSVENPSRVFLARLKARFAEENISVDFKDLGPGVRKQILQHVSAPIDEIMRSCMMRSDNLYAESFLRTFGKLNGGDGSVEDSALKERELWSQNGIPLENITIIDGSGLSRSNRITAEFITAILSSMNEDVNYASFFPLAGQDGTLAKFLKDTPLDSYIALKTGSMKGIQCYAGYKLDEDYVPTHTVVIIMNEINGSRDKARKAAERLLLNIFPDPPAIIPPAP